MLIEPNTYLRVYVIRWDFGFAPNPFHGYCTLATCKPTIRKSAKIGDWVLGIGGKELGAAHKKCILLMKVSEKLSFQDYWGDLRFSHKKPSRNGSNVTMVGDNIYHKGSDETWIQEDSQHSKADGTTNLENLNRDTGSCDQVLVSNHFFYFGESAVPIDLESIGYHSGPGYKKINLSQSAVGRGVIEKIYKENRWNLNTVVSDPCQFQDSHKRVDQKSGNLS